MDNNVSLTVGGLSSLHDGRYFHYVAANRGMVLCKWYGAGT